MVHQYMIKMEKKSIMINKIKNIIYIIIGIYFITSPFIFKIIIIKLPKTLAELSLIIALFFLFFYFYLMIKGLRSLFKMPSNELYFIKVFRDNIIIPLQEIYYNSMKKIDNYIKHDFLGPEYLGKNLLKITLWVNKNITNNTFIKCFFFLDILPKILFIIIFLYDVVFKHKLVYTYYFGGFLLIPLIFSYIMSTFKEFALTNMKIAHNDYLLFVDEHYHEICLDNVLQNYEATSLKQIQILNVIKYISVKNKEHYDNLEETLTYYTEQFHIFTKLYNSCILYDHINNIMLFKCLSIGYYLCYFLIWLYIVLLKIL